MALSPTIQTDYNFMFKKDKYPPHIEEDLSVGKQALIFFWELFKVVAISLAIIIPVRTFLIKPFYVKGASMEPNFHDKEYLIINEISYYFGDPVRGDSVVFKYPVDPTQFFIKRIVALPGERIVISNGKIFIYNNYNPNGQELAEPYLIDSVKTLGDIDETLGPAQYFLLGDNRIHSLDSRAFGPVDRKYIVGKTLLRGWPPGKIGLTINNLDYNL